MRALWIAVLVLGVAACDGAQQAEVVPEREAVRGSGLLPDLSGHEPAVAEKLRAAHRAVSANGDARARVHLARCLFAHLEFRAARDAFRAAADVPGAHRFESLYLSGVAASFADVPVAEAIADVDAALALRADYAPAHLRAGDLAESTGAVAVARERYESALALERTSHALLGLARTYVAEGDLERAVGLLEQARATNPRHVEVSIALAATLTKLGRADEALAVAAVIPPRHTRTRFRDDIVLRARAESVSQFGLLEQADRAAAAGYTNDALLFLDRAIATSPEPTGAYMRKGRLLAAHGQHDAAIAIYRQVLRLKPECGVAWSLRGECEAAAGRSDDALYAFRKGVSVSPASVDTRYPLARFLSDRDEADEALAIVGPIAVEAPDHLPARILYARLLARRGESASAREQAEAVLRRAPTNAEARALLAELGP